MNDSKKIHRFFASAVSLGSTGAVFVAGWERSWLAAPLVIMACIGYTQVICWREKWV